MIEIENLEQVAAQIESERGISRDVLFTAIEQALISACKKRYSEDAEVSANLDANSGQLTLYFDKLVVKTKEDVLDDILEISLADAKKVQSNAKLDELIKVPLVDPDFGRYATQVARQVIIQRLREEEKNIVYDYFKAKEGQLIQATVQSVERNYYLMNLGKTEASLSFRDCISTQQFSAKDTVLLYVVSVDKTIRRPNIYISRTHPGFLQQLLTQEIPEIQDGIIEIKAVSRQAGERAKVAVKSNNPSIGAVGTCVGPMGGRIQTVIEELGGKERIDILEWDENISKFISNTLKPAKISQVLIIDESEKKAAVVTEKDQLSLAIGKQGQNVRLASRLTGWQLDVMDEDTFNERRSEFVSDDEPSLIEKMASAKAAANEQEPEIVDSNTISLKEKIAASKKEEATRAVMPTDTPDISVSSLAKLFGFDTATALIEALKGKVEISSTRAKLNTETVEKIKEILSR